MSISIEKNIPIPRRTTLPDMPLEKIKKKESFLVPMSSNDTRTAAALRQRVCRYQLKSGRKFSVVKDDGGMRVFRTK